MNSTEQHWIATRIAMTLSILWVILFAAYFYWVPQAAVAISQNDLGMPILASLFFLPLVLIWTVSMLARSIGDMRAEAQEIRQTLDEMRKTIEIEGGAKPGSQVEKQLSEIAALTQKTDSRVTELAAKTFETRGENLPPRDIAALGGNQPQSEDPGQADLPLLSPLKAERTPITVKEFIKALNFPDNADDKEGFRVLRRAFDERELSKLLQASQDVLTLLSQDGVYMDELRPDSPPAAAWRKFAKGERGLSVAALGGIRDRSSLALAKGRMKNDPIFRDAAHHFLRQFDTVLTEFEQTAEDGELLEMGKTRSALAFMLLGRVTGAFD